MNCVDLDFDVKACLAASRLFSWLDQAALTQLVEVFEWQLLLRGQTLFRQGDSGDAFYLVASGRLRILTPSAEGVDTPVGELLAGESFGELALISDAPRAATIVAVRDTQLGKLSRAQFHTILHRHPTMALKLLDIVGEWLKQPPLATTQQASTIVTLVVLSSQQAVTTLAASLAAALARRSTVQHFTLAQLDQVICLGASDKLGEANDGGQLDERLSRWLSQQEQQCDYLILETSAAASKWAHFCCRQADKLLYLVHSSDSPQAVPAHLVEPVSPDAELELVLVHDDSTLKPLNTARWLTQTPVTRHHHLRQGRAADIERLGRDITHDALAVVLGGGGARSFGQIGVLKAMEELGLTIDRIGGTSMGAIIAAQYADGHPPDQLLAMNHEIWVRNKPQHDFTLPITSLLAARRAKRLTRMVFDDRDIEDLWLHFFCVSTDLTHLKPHIHRRGTVWSALLASGAVPGICSSIVSDEGALLVDGGVLDNLPVGVMRHHHRGTIIAVDVSPTKGLQPNVTTTIPPNGWRALSDYLNPMAKHRRYPHVFELLMHTAALTSKVNAESSRHLADLCLTPPSDEHGLMDMRNLEVLAERAYQYALPKLAQWLTGAVEKR